MSKFIFALAATVVAGSALLAPTQAKAYGVQGNGTAFCQAALPVFDTNLRKRPLAVVNEGSTNTYVTCSYPVDSYAGGVWDVDVYLSNHTGADQDVNCTLVDGYDNGDVLYIARTTTAVDAATTEEEGDYYDAYWNAGDDNEGLPFGTTVSISCSLPAGIGLADQYVNDANFTAL
jgi:hypothetical protein